MSDSQVTVLAIFKAVKGKEEQLKEQLTKLPEPTRQEIGCINYDLHQDSEDSGSFMFYENWKSMELLENHLASEHITAFKAKAPDLVEEREITIWEKL